MTDDLLATYHGKRDLDTSGEPAGGRAADGAPRFVIQRHDASSLHFDVRLEIEDVLVSWAVPKGPSTDPAEKRLARRTEDHPLDYVDFEGRIPSGYGAGTVVVWDTGTFEHTTERDGSPVTAGEALEHGHLTVTLHGSKLTGGYALTRTRDANWLMIKIKDDDVDRRRRPTTSQPESVLTGHTNADYENDGRSPDHR